MVFFVASAAELEAADGATWFTTPNLLKLMIRHRRTSVMPSNTETNRAGPDRDSMQFDGADKTATAIVWFRSDLRLADNAALWAASEHASLVPVYVRALASQSRPLGGAGNWWLNGSLARLSESLSSLGSPLVLASGDPFLVLCTLADQTGASAVYWNRRHDPEHMEADALVKSRLIESGLVVRSFPGQLLHEPTRLKTGSGGSYRVYTPFWRALEAQGYPPPPLPAPAKATAPKAELLSEALADWALHPTRPDWSNGLSATWTPGEAGAQSRLASFVLTGIRNYAEGRDVPSVENTSRLSPHLAHGEITPRQILHALAAAQTEGSERDRTVFRKEIGWREFSWHLLVNQPKLAQENHNPRFDTFPWRADDAALAAWQKGETGYPIVDAGMRQLWQTGWMHNRVRMIVASFLSKHLLIDWRQGEAWFWDTLVDADAASNPAGWQWVAGSGADAAPYFRIFNPVLQGEKFDPDGTYVRTFVPELSTMPASFIHKPWEAPDKILIASGTRLGKTYPNPIVQHRAARDRALSAYSKIKDAA